MCAPPSSDLLQAELVLQLLLNSLSDHFDTGNGGLPLIWPPLGLILYNSLNFIWGGGGVISFSKVGLHSA